MAGNVTITVSDKTTVKISWVADSADGSVPQTEFDITILVDIIGQYSILGITDPGSPAPTDKYDIEILDEYGVDVFGGNLKDRSTTVSEQAVPKIGDTYYGERLCAGAWTFKLTNNSVNSAQGKCILYFKQ